MAYGMTRDTYSPVEVTLYKTGDNHYTLPHTYSCTQQLRLLRYMLLREEDRDLVLTQGIPSAWLQPAKRIAVTAAPTRFGPVTFSIEAESSEGVRVRLDPPTRSSPREIRIHLRHPEGLAIATVKTSSGEQPAIDGNVIRLSGPTDFVELSLAFSKPE
jgi:hypothetical protein